MILTKNRELGELMKFFPIKGGINPGTDLNTIGGAEYIILVGNIPMRHFLNHGVI
jgi:hypothetical protein